MSELLLTQQLMHKPMMQNLDVVRTDKVREITIHVTQFCNLRCRGCYVPIQNEEKAQKLEISDLEWINKTFNPEKTLLLGGEPLAYPYLEDALKVFKHVSISTNGIYMKEKIDLLKRYKVVSQISIEGRKAYTDKIRGKDVYEKAIEAGILAKQEGLKCHFRMGYCEKNLRDVDWLLKNVSAKHGIPLVLLPRLDQPPMSIDKQIYLFDLITSAGNDSLVDMPHFFQYLGKRGRCLAGSERLNFNYDRAITPCQFDWNYTIGHIGQPKEVINKSREMYISTCKYVKRECINCSRADICKGGCRMTNAHLGCPLKADFDINSYVEMHGNTDVGSLVDKIDRLVSLVKDAEIC